MKNIILCLILCLVSSCFNNTDIDELVAEEYRKCNSENSCIIDMSSVIGVDWDTMYYFSASLSLGEMNYELGFKLKNYIDIGDRVVFTKDKKVVYYKEWFPDPNKPAEGVIFKTEDKKMKVSKQKAKFKLSKEGQFLYLELL